MRISRFNGSINSDNYSREIKLKKFGNSDFGILENKPINQATFTYTHNSATYEFYIEECFQHDIGFNMSSDLSKANLSGFLAYLLNNDPKFKRFLWGKPQKLATGVKISQDMIVFMPRALKKNSDKNDVRFNRDYSNDNSNFQWIYFIPPDILLDKTLYCDFLPKTKTFFLRNSRLMVKLFEKLLVPISKAYTLKPPKESTKILFEILKKFRREHQPNVRNNTYSNIISPLVLNKYGSLSRVRGVNGSVKYVLEKDLKQQDERDWKLINNFIKRIDNYIKNYPPRVKKYKCQLFEECVKINSTDNSSKRNTSHTLIKPCS